jgi:hypothetical protein
MFQKLLEKVQLGMTHLVAAKDGTDKAVAARKIPGCVLVKPAWLVECYWSMTRLDIKPHLMGQGVADTTKPKPQPLQESKVDNSSEGSSSSDSEDDGLAAEFENELMNAES